MCEVNSRTRVPGIVVIVLLALRLRRNCPNEAVSTDLQESSAMSFEFEPPYRSGHVYLECLPFPAGILCFMLAVPNARLQCCNLLSWWRNPEWDCESMRYTAIFCRL